MSAPAVEALGLFSIDVSLEGHPRGKVAHFGIRDRTWEERNVSGPRKHLERLFLGDE